MQQTSQDHSLVVVTGASNGIGLELALCAARDGHQVLLVARGMEALASAAEQVRAAGSPAAHVLGADLATDEGVAAVVHEVERIALPLAALVNNAGFGDWGPFAGQDITRIETMVDLNARAVVTLTRHLLGRVLAARGGVLTVASTAAFQPGPGMAVYHATKAFALAFSVALREELRGTGARATALCPGPVPTGFADAAGLEAYDEMKLARVASQSAERVARLGWRGLHRNKAIILPGTLNRVAATSTRLVPVAVATRMARAALGALDNSGTGGRH